MLPKEEWSEEKKYRMEQLLSPLPNLSTDCRLKDWPPEASLTFGRRSLCLLCEMDELPNLTLYFKRITILPQSLLYLPDVVRAAGFKDEDHF